MIVGQESQIQQQHIQIHDYESKIQKYFKTKDQYKCIIRNLKDQNMALNQKIVKLKFKLKAAKQVPDTFVQKCSKTPTLQKLNRLEKGKALNLIFSDENF